jgi:hypothetical protein
LDEAIFGGEKTNITHVWGNYNNTWSKIVPKWRRSGFDIKEVGTV